MDDHVVKRQLEHVASQVWRTILGATRSGSLRVLAYHGVTDSAAFQQQIEHLVNAYYPVGPDDVVAALNGEQLPGKSVWVTFDDGDPTVVDIALPILTKYGIPATMFICPALIDTNEPYWWQVVEEAASTGISHNGSPMTQETVRHLKSVPDDRRRIAVRDIRNLAESSAGKTLTRPQLTSEQLNTWISSGHTVGNHTWDHPLLDMCGPVESEAQVRRAHDWVAAKLGQPPTLFAYPNGNFDETAENTLRSLGYEAGLLFDHRLSSFGMPLRMSRLRTNANGDITRFRAIVSGLHPLVHHLRGRT